MSQMFHPSGEMLGDSCDADGGRRALALCCIGRTTELPLPCGGGYEPDHRLRVIDDGPLRAVAIDLDATYFVGSDIANRLESDAWLAPRVERHEAIIAEAARSGPVVPARFGCVFSGEMAVRDMLAGHESLLWAALENVDGASEYGISVLVDPARAADAMDSEGMAGRDGDPSGADAGGGAGGASWMVRRGPRRDGSKALESWLDRRLRDPIGAIGREARCACRHRIIEKKCERHEVVAKWSYLVSHEDDASFRAAARRAASALAHIGAEVAISGPLAPYSFAPSVSAG